MKTRNEQAAQLFGEVVETIASGDFDLVSRGTLISLQKVGLGRPLVRSFPSPRPAGSEGVPWQL